MHSIHRCTWKSSQFFIIIIMMASFMRVTYELVIHQSKCISAIKCIHSTTAMFIPSSSFIYLYIPTYCDACLKSSALRVGVKTLYSTIQCSWRLNANADVFVDITSSHKESTVKTFDWEDSALSVTEHSSFGRHGRPEWTRRRFRTSTNFSATKMSVSWWKSKILDPYIV